MVAEFQRRVDQTREDLLTQAFLDAGIDGHEVRILARIGLTILVGTQQIEERVDRSRIDDLLSEYQQWLESRRYNMEQLPSVPDRRGHRRKKE